MSCASENSVFDEAYRQFQNLPQSQKNLYAPTATPQDVLDGLEKLQIITQCQKRRGLTVFDRVKLLHDRLKPYFDIMGVFIQSNPKYAALIWGSFRLVLELASNYKSFFEKLVDVIDDIAAVFPRYDSLVSILKQFKNLHCREPIKSDLEEIPYSQDADGFDKDVDRGSNGMEDNAGVTAVTEKGMASQPNTDPEHIRRHASIQSGISERMEFNLTKVYLDVLEFFQEVAQIFVRGNGTPRKYTKILGSMLWTPFEVRFKNLLQRMSRHRGYVESELQLMITWISYNTNVTTLERQRLDVQERQAKERSKEIITNILAQHKSIEGLLKEQHEKALFDDICGWLNPPEFTEALQRHQSLREEGTNYWIFEKVQFQRWKNGKVRAIPNSCTEGTASARIANQNLLWISGNPGCGKTVLASSIIQLLQDEKDAGKSQREVFYYLFDAANYPTNATPRAALRSILFQIVQHNRRNKKVFDAFSFAMRTGHCAARQATLYELADLLIICLNILGDSYLIIDGVDECADEFLIRHLLKTVEQCPSKILLLSRPNVCELVRKVTNACQFKVDQSCTSRDIRLYLTRQIRSFTDEGIVSSTGDPLELVEHLVKGANGMFLWAKLMVSYLKLPIFNPQWRLQTIRGIILPEGLERMYSRILDLIDGFGHTQRDIARRTFTWLLYSVEPLTSRQLQEAMLGHKEGSGPLELMRHEDWQMTLTMACGGMVEVYWAENQLTKAEEPYFRLIHLSVHEYLRKFRQVSQSGSSNDSMPRAQSTISAELTLSCLKEIEDHAPTNPSSAVIGLYGEQSTGRIAMLSSFTSYSYYHWMDHLANAFSGGEISALGHNDYSETFSKLAAALSCFLQSPILITAWLEAAYTVSSIKKHDAPAIPSSWVAVLARLSNYADMIKDEEPILGQLRRPLKRVTDLANELEILESAWGLKLLSTPSIVWDEATAFLNSRFMLQSTTAKVTALESGRRESSKSSSQALAQVSTTTLDGRYIAVVTIWPSKVYEQSWQELDVAGSFASARYLCCGWIAEYEIFAVDGDLSRVAQLDIPLEDVEIWVQLRQSLHRDASSWRTSFPMAISEDVKSFVILRKLFVIKSAGRHRLSSVRSVTIPMDFSQHLADNWFVDTATTEDKNTQKTLSLRCFPHLYTYFLTFNADARYLCFTDSHRASHKSQSCLAVFEIDDSMDLNVSFVGGIICPTRCRDAISSVMFHPACDLVAIYNDGQVDVWRFRSAEGTVTSLRKKGDIGMRKSFADKPESMALSNCGNYLILTMNSAKTTSTVLKIPDKELTAASSIKRTSSEQGQAQSASRELAAFASMDVSALSLRPGQLLKGSHLGFEKDGDGSQVLSIRVKDAITMDVTSTQQPDTLQSLQLISLPVLPGAERTATAVRIPEDESENIRIFLNRDSQRVYYPSDEQIMGRFPMVIERSPSSVIHAVTANVTELQPSRQPKKLN